MDEGPIARRMGELIGSDIHMLQPTEADLTAVFEDLVWHCEGPHFSLHGVGKTLLSRYVREQGYKVCSIVIPRVALCLSSRPFRLF